MRSELMPEELAREDVWVDEKGLIHLRRTVNHAPLINDNEDQKKDPAKGFTPNRHFQRLARVPPEVFHNWAIRTGYYDMDREQRKMAKYKFLKENPQWWTVENLVTKTPSDGHVILK